MAGAVTRTLTLVLIITSFSAGALAQGRGVAPLFFPPHDGSAPYYAVHRYPSYWTGTVWTGTVKAIHGRKISLIWIDKKGKVEAFAGEVVSYYYVPFCHGSDESSWCGGTQTVPVDPPTQDLIGKTVMAYYMTNARKVMVKGKKTKVKTNYIFRLDPTKQRADP
jgi:hypothetical protein